MILSYHHFWREIFLETNLLSRGTVSKYSSNRTKEVISHVSSFSLFLLSPLSPSLCYSLFLSLSMSLSAEVSLSGPWYVHERNFLSSREREREEDRREKKKEEEKFLSQFLSHFFRQEDRLKCEVNNWKGILLELERERIKVSRRKLRKVSKRERIFNLSSDVVIEFFEFDFSLNLNQTQIFLSLSSFSFFFLPFFCLFFEEREKKIFLKEIMFNEASNKRFQTLGIHFFLPLFLSYFSQLSFWYFDTS